MENTDPFNQLPGARSAIASLRRFSKPRGPEERCDLCSAPLAVDHQHLLDPAKRQIVCSCDACAILFSSSNAKNLRRVPRRIEKWLDFQISDMQWAGLGVPIALSFFYQSTPLNQITAMYPSPAGATESMLPGDSWDSLVEMNPRLRELEPDVETLLVNRMNGARNYYRAPIDECFKLVGLVRSTWRGLSGGIEMWKQVGAFFVELDQRAIQIGTALLPPTDTTDLATQIESIPQDQSSTEA